MIYKNQEFGIAIDATIAEFGTGDIIVATGSDKLNDDVTYVMFTNNQPTEIGTEFTELHGKTSNELAYDIVFRFDNVKSIDVVMEALEKAKTKILKK